MGNFNKGHRSGGRGGGKDFGRGGRDRGRTEMHRAVCNDCGKDCEVPFRPTGDKPVYCSDCFRGKDSSSSRDSRGGRDNRAPRPRFDAGGRGSGLGGADFEQISSKLDTIIRLLSADGSDVAEKPAILKIKESKKQVKREVDEVAVKGIVKKMVSKKKDKKTVAKKVGAKKVVKKKKVAKKKK